MYAVQKVLLSNFLNTWVCLFPLNYPTYYRRVDDCFYSNNRQNGDWVGFGDITINYEPKARLNSKNNRALAIIPNCIYQEIAHFSRHELIDTLSDIDLFTTTMAEQFGNWAESIFDDEEEFSQHDYSLDMATLEAMKGIQVY